LKKIHKENILKNTNPPMTGSIRNIIFDFGGVIFDISHEKLERAYRDLGLDNFDLLFSKASQTDLFRHFEKGEITPGEFRESLREMTGLAVDDATLDATWNGILCDYPPHRIELLLTISRNYRLYLLSNTNEIHYRHYTSLFKDRYGYDFSELFDDTFWSFKIGLRKPDPDPYLYILGKHCLQPAETLFIDDSMQNIAAAEKLGILALHLESEVSGLFGNGLLRKEVISHLFDKHSHNSSGI